MREMEGNFNPKLEILWGGKGVAARNNTLRGLQSLPVTIERV